MFMMPLLKQQCWWRAPFENAQKCGRLIEIMFVVSITICVSTRACRAEEGRRPVTVADMIRMTEIVNIDGGGFSADKKRFVVLLKRGNVERNFVDYSLLLFHTESIFQSPIPRLLASFSSSSNRPGIQDVKWIDHHTLVFLGEQPGQTQQLYSVDSESGERRRLTDHKTNLTGYVVARNGEIFFTAESAVESLINEKTSREGMIVSHEALSDLISLQTRRQSAEHQLLFSKKPNENERLLEGVGINGFSSMSLWLSPDGRYLIVKRMVTQSPPKWWSLYQDRWIQEEIRENRYDRVLRALNQFEIIDTTSGRRSMLLDAPIGYGQSQILWSKDMNSVIVSGTFLPLDVSDPALRNRRRCKRFVAEIEIPSLKIAAITDEQVTTIEWDPEGKAIFCQTDTKQHSSGPGTAVLAYKKSSSVWTKMGASQRKPDSASELEIIAESDLNTAPRLFAVDPSTQKKSLLLDPNPQFKELDFGKVELISFAWGKGHRAKAEIYFPIGFVPGRRYPLVIQTHAIHLGNFAVDGPYTTAFAAQPLAGHGFIVAQLEEDLARERTANEVTDEASTYEGIIQYLDNKGLVEVNRVGIIGFSRTGLAVEYALTHSKYHFAAASLADISDAGYFRYVALLNNNPGFGIDSEIANGGSPFGKGIKLWLKNSPGFNLKRVAASVRLEANEPMSLLFVWEWFVGLSHLKKPVELVYLPEADHVLVKPLDRLVSQQGNVDWFCFWLKHEEDCDPDKAGEYTRWRALRTAAVQAAQ